MAESCAPCVVHALSCGCCELVHSSPIVGLDWSGLDCCAFRGLSGLGSSNLCSDGSERPRCTAWPIAKRAPKPHGASDIACAAEEVLENEFERMSVSSDDDRTPSMHPSPHRAHVFVESPSTHPTAPAISGVAPTYCRASSSAVGGMGFMCDRAARAENAHHARGTTYSYAGSHCEVSTAELEIECPLCCWEHGLHV